MGRVEASGTRCSGKGSAMLGNEKPDENRTDIVQRYSGIDPMHNYMDYSSDICYTGFSAGQAARMINLWVLYRDGN